MTSREECTLLPFAAASLEIKMLFVGAIVHVISMDHFKLSVKQVKH